MELKLNTTEMNIALGYLRLYQRQVSGDQAESVVFERIGSAFVAAMRSKYASATYQLSIRDDGRLFEPFAISVERLGNLCRVLGDDKEICVLPGKDRHVVEFPGGCLRLVAYEVGEPYRPQRKQVEPIKIAASKLSAMIESVRHAASNRDDGNRYALASVLIEVMKDEIAVVASDGTRMAIRQDTVEVAEKSDEAADRDESVRHIRIVVPARAVQLLSATLVPGTDALLWPSDSHLFVSSGPRRTVLPLCEGRFPDFRTLFDHAKAAKTGSVTFDHGELFAAVRSHIAFMEKDASGMDIMLTNTGVAVTTVNGSEAEVTFKPSGEFADGYIFNVKYFLEALRATADLGEKVVLELDSKGVATSAFRCGSHTELIMPMARSVSEK